LLDEHTDLSVLLITGSPVIHNFNLPSERFDYIKLPCLARDQAGHYDVKQLDIEFENVVSLRAQTIKIAIQNFNPDLVLVDKKPCGVANELIPALQATDNPVSKTKWGLLLRDILDAPEVTQKIWRKHAYSQIIERYYAKILVVGSANIFDICHEYALPKQLHKITGFCGYLHKNISTPPEKLSRIKHSDEQKTVLVTPGGGEDGYQLIKHYLNGLRQQPLPDGYKSLIITGPEMSVDQQMRIQATASQLTAVEVKIFTANLLAYMAESSLIVSMAGYNTVCEILSLNKPAVVVPRHKPVKEQLIRAERFAKRGLLRFIHPEQVNGKQLLDAVHAEINHDSPRLHPSDVLDFNGLGNINKHLSELLVNNQQINISRVDHGEQCNANPIKAKNRVSTKNMAKNIRDIRLAGNTCPST